MQETTFQPIQQNQRIVIIDALRGWALLGVVLMNYIDFYYMGTTYKALNPGVFSTILIMIGNVFFAAKSWTMLSFLFGYGFAVLMDNTHKKGINANAFFAKRMFWLLVIAVINSAFFWGDILKDYAVLGLVLLAFHRCSVKTIFYTCIGLFLIAPFLGAYINNVNKYDELKLLGPYYHLYKSHNILDVLEYGLIGTWKAEVTELYYITTIHVVMLSCFLLGLAAQKINFFGRITENLKTVKKIFWYSLATEISVLLIALVLFYVLKIKFYNYFDMQYVIVIPMMLFIASALCWLFVAGKLKKFFISMQVIGKMTLTNYLVQNIIGLLLFSGFGFGFSMNHKLDAGYYYLFAMVIYILQIYFSKWWLARYYYGPVEWVWRQLCYGKRLAIRKE